MKYLSKIIIIGAALLYNAHSAVIYTQDFSDNSGVSSDNLANTDFSDDNVLTAVAGEIVTGSNYTLVINSINGGQSDGYVFNPSAANTVGRFNTAGSGLALSDTSFTYSSSSISFVSSAGGAISTGTFSLSGSIFNVGEEFASFNLFEVVQDDITGRVTLTIDYNAFGDFGSTDGNESLRLTTNFGLATDVTNLRISDLVAASSGADQTISDTYVLELVPQIVPEPSAMLLLSLSTCLLLTRRKR